MPVLQPGDLIVGFQSQYIPVWRAGVQLMQMDSGYPHDATQYGSDASGFVQVGDFLYVTRWTTNAGFITNAIQKFDLDGNWVADIFTETIANTGTGGALTTREFIGLTADGDGNLYVGMLNTVDFLALSVPPTTMNMLEKYDLSGTLLGAFIPITLQSFVGGSNNPLVASVQSMTYAPSTNQVYYAAAEFTPATAPTEVQARYIHLFDVGSSSYGGQFYDANTVSQTVRGVTRRGNGEIWATGANGFPAPQVMRLSSTGTLLETWDLPDVDGYAYQIAIDCDDLHFWLAAFALTEIDAWQIAEVEMATGTTVLYSVPTTDHGPTAGEMSTVYILPCPSVGSTRRRGQLLILGMGR